LNFEKIFGEIHLRDGDRSDPDKVLHLPELVAVVRSVGNKCQVGILQRNEIINSIIDIIGF